MMHPKDMKEWEYTEYLENLLLENEDGFFRCFECQKIIELENRYKSHDIIDGRCCEECGPWAFEKQQEEGRADYEMQREAYDATYNSAHDWTYKVGK